MIVFLVVSITCIRREKGYRIVTPVVVQLCAVHHSGALHLIELKNWHQFDRIDSEIF